MVNYYGNIIIRLIASLALTSLLGVPLPTCAQSTSRPDYKTILLPGFFDHKPVPVNDTTYSYELFNVNHARIVIDTLSSPQNIGIIYYYKSYLIPVSHGPAPSFYKRVSEYERLDSTKWIKTDKLSTSSTNIAEHKDIIIRIDTVVKHDKAGNEHLYIYKYYKTEAISTEKGNQENHHHHHHH